MKSVQTKIQEFDRLLGRAAMRAEPGRKKGPPSWWHGDEEAARSSMAAAAQLGARGARGR